MGQTSVGCTSSWAANLRPQQVTNLGGVGHQHLILVTEIPQYVTMGQSILSPSYGSSLINTAAPNSH